MTEFTDYFNGKIEKEVIMFTDKLMANVTAENKRVIAIRIEMDEINKKMVLLDINFEQKLFWNEIKYYCACRFVHPLKLARNCLNLKAANKPFPWE